MSLPMVTSATEQDRQAVVRTITLGFATDPMVRWFWPKAETYLEVMPKFVDAFAGRAFKHGTGYCTEDVTAAALWLPPGVSPDHDTIGEIVGASVAPDFLTDALPVFERMNACRPVDTPYWYLPLIAADPFYTGRGLGAALMKHALRRCDEDGMTAILESSNPRNISLYERHGFEVIESIQIGSSPVMTPMIRKAR